MRWVVIHREEDTTQRRRGFSQNDSAHSLGILLTPSDFPPGPTPEYMRVEYKCGQAPGKEIVPPLQREFGLALGLQTRE